LEGFHLQEEASELIEDHFEVPKSSDYSSEMVQEAPYYP
jgi:hypothetical protein